MEDEEHLSLCLGKNSALAISLAFTTLYEATMRTNYMRSV